MYGDISPELQRCKDMILMTMFCGAFIGGIGRSRVAYANFFKSNAHTAFETPLQARVCQSSINLIKAVFYINI